VQVGELFINLSIKGADVVGKAVQGAKDGIGGLASMSLEAKAAIVGMGVALEESLRITGQRGNDLTNFSKSLGVAVETIGGLENEFRKLSGVGRGELYQTLSSIQKVQAEMIRNKSISGEMQLFVKNTHADVDRLKTDIPYFLEMARKFAQLPAAKTRPGVVKDILGQIGISESDAMYSALVSGKHDLTKLKPGNSLNGRQADELANNYKRLLDLKDQIEKFTAKETIKFGGSAITDIENTTLAIEDLADAFLDLNKQLHIFSAVGTAIEGFATIFHTLASDVRVLSGNGKAGNEYDQNTGALLDVIKKYTSGETYLSYLDQVSPSNLISGGGNSSHQETQNVNVTNHIYGTKADDASVLTKAELERLGSKLKGQRQVH
jgi:hypothetical protein